MNKDIRNAKDRPKIKCLCSCRKKSSSRGDKKGPQKIHKKIAYSF